MQDNWTKSKWRKQKLVLSWSRWKHLHSEIRENNSSRAFLPFFFLLCRIWHCFFPSFSLSLYLSFSRFSHSPFSYLIPRSGSLLHWTSIIALWWISVLWIRHKKKCQNRSKVFVLQLFSFVDLIFREYAKLVMRREWKTCKHECYHTSECSSGPESLK